MAGAYSQTFTLKEIFNNKNLRGKLPLINYKETQREDGKISRRTNVRSVPMQVYDLARSGAKGYYKPLLSEKRGNTIVIDGKLTGDYDQAYESIYNTIYAGKDLITFTANNADMIRSALKEAERNKSRLGIDSKLYLRAQSMAQIEGMSRKELWELMTNVMENIIFGDDFPITQKKYNIKETIDGQVGGKNGLNYTQRRLRWKYKVGAV